jgi:WW domain-containing oxidoreductase
VVVLSSEAHRMSDKHGLELDNAHGEDNYHPWRMYGRSKLANILFARALARQFAAEGQQKTANAVHPGVIRTNLARHVANPDRMFDRLKKLEKTVAQGAATQCYAATHPSLAGTSGRYLSDCTHTEPIAAATSDAEADALWAWTAALVAGI